VWPIIAAIVAGGIALATQVERSKPPGKSYDDGVKDGSKKASDEYAAKQAEQRRFDKLVNSKAKAMARSRYRRFSRDDEDDDDDETVTPPDKPDKEGAK
jgi:hypothetical protein